MHDDPLIESRGVARGPEPEAVTASLPSEREGGVAAPEELFARAEELYAAIRADLAVLLDRCRRWQHPEPCSLPSGQTSAAGVGPNSGTSLIREDLRALDVDLERLYDRLAECRSTLEAAFGQVRRARPDSAGFGDLEQLGDFCRRIAAGEALLYERLRPLLDATWRHAEDAWRHLGRKVESWRRRDAEQLAALGEAFRDLAHRRLGIDPTSSGVWTTALVGTNAFDELLLGLERERAPLAELAAWVRLAAPGLEQTQARILFAALLPRLIEECALAESLDGVLAVEELVGLFAGHAFFDKRRHSDGIDFLLEHLNAQLRRWLQRDWRRPASRSRGDEPATPIDDRAYEAALARLPAQVQRLLARQGRFVEVFAGHGENLVAREVAHHLHAGNIGRVLQVRELNRRLFEELLRFVPIEGESLTLALCHASCPLVFASRNLARLNPAQLHRLIQEPGALPEIKRKAMLAMIRSRSGQNVPAEVAIPADPGGPDRP